MIKDGDIFRWRYKDETPEQRRPWGRYHCKSQFSIARDGVLMDTYWGSHSEVRWSYSDAEAQLNLELLGNLSELEKRPDYHALYYDAADCVNINHANSSRDNFYVRKGAVRSREQMKAALAERIDETEREIRFRQDKLERDRATLAHIDAGADLEGIYL